MHKLLSNIKPKNPQKGDNFVQRFLKVCIIGQPPSKINGNTGVGTSFEHLFSAMHYQDIGPKDVALTPCFSKCSISNNFLPHCSEAQANHALDVDPVSTAKS